jgi:capsular exopolysaccharide synthesis family protein
MKDNRKQTNEELSVDLGRALQALLKNGLLIGLVAVLCALVVFAGTFFLVTPKYESAAMFYVNNNNLSFGDTSVSISSGDLSTSRNLVDSYIVILNTRATLKDVIDYAGVPYTEKELQKMISANAVNDTEIFRVVVNSPDPQEAEKIASAIAYILPKRIGTIIDGTTAKVVDTAVVPSSSSSPNYIINAVVGFLIGFVVMAGVIVLRTILDINIRTEDDVTQSCQHPILAEVPDMNAHSKGSSYYSYGSSRSGKKKGKYTAGSRPEKLALMGPGISFAASESYKLLRTKLQFSFADENDCHVIGLSSALSGEGKSLTTVNLAFALSQLNKKVLLVDCDMRRPTLAEKLGILKYPGLSSYLTRQCAFDELLQQCKFDGSENAFHVIAAGHNPPNPVELLSSDRMKNALEIMRKAYDYVILDLPPVGEVSDAMAIAKETDGILLVVRQNYCDRVVLAEAARQFNFINAKTLGVIFNCTSEHSGKYGKGYYKRSYKRYYKGYRAYGYAHAAQDAGSNEQA